MDNIGISGLTMQLNEKVDELNNLVKRAKKGTDEAEIVAEAIDIIDHKRYSYLCALLERLHKDKASTVENKTDYSELEKKIDDKIKGVR